MTIEEKLKQFILTRYNSIREFSIEAEIPNSTMASILSRSIDNASIGNIMLICETLNISVDALARHEIELIRPKHKHSKELDTIINDTVFQLNSNDITINGKKVDIEIVEPVIEALEIGRVLAKNKNSHAKNHKQKL